MWRPINFTLHVCWFVAVIVLLSDFNFVDPSLYNAVLASDEREVFSLAVQLGRLDFLNSVLAILALVIAGGAIFGILEVRKGAEMKAEATAKPIAEKVARETAENEIRPEANRIVEEFFERKGIDLNKLPKKEVNSVDDGSDPNQPLADAM